MEGTRSKKATNPELQRDNDEKSDEDKISHSELTSVTQPTETASVHGGDLSPKTKASGNDQEEAEKKEGELLECTTATKRKKKKKKKQKKKKPDPLSTEAGNTDDPVCIVEEPENATGGPTLSKPTLEEGHEKTDEELEPSSPRRKKKKKKTKKTQDVTEHDDDHVTEHDAKSDHRDLEEAGMSSGEVETGQSSCQTRGDLEEVAPKAATAEVQGNSEEMENKMQKDKECKPSSKEVSDSVVSGLDNGSQKASECTPDEGAELLTGGEDIPASDEKTGHISPEVVPVSVGSEATAGNGAEETAEGNTKCTDLMGEVDLSDTEDPYVRLDHEGRNVLCIFKLVYGVGL